MVTIEPMTAIRPANDIDWLEEEAWRRASQWVCTPQLVFSLKALIFQEIQLKPGQTITPYDFCREIE